MSTHSQPGRQAPAPQTSRGFSLIELLIVIAIILIIAAIAIPQLLRARIAANEAAACETVRTLTTASMAYNATWNNGYPPNMQSLGGVAGALATCNQADLMDPVVASPPYQKSGYAYAYTAVGTTVIPPSNCGAAGSTAYLVTATPVVEGVTGVRSFCSDEPGVIYFDTTGATAASESACEALIQLQ
jgi:type IV pilus assembly protein PilA